MQSYRIDNNVYLDLNKTSPTLSDIKVGMIVTLKLQDNIVYEINLQNKIKGEIEQIDSQRAIITVKTDAGRKNYKIDNALIRILGVTNARIRDLEVGQQVVLTLVEGSVDRVDVITTKISTVTTIETTANRIGIKDGSSTARYYVYPDTTIVISGIKNPSLRDLKQVIRSNLLLSAESYSRSNLFLPVSALLLHSACWQAGLWCKPIRARKQSVLTIM